MGPAGPADPVRPMGPAGPVDPVGPVGPSGPVDPVRPAGPAGPVAPVRPVGPAGPVAPVRPAGPVAPAGPLFTRVTSNSAGWLVVALSLLSRVILMSPSAGAMRKPLLVVPDSQFWTAAVASTTM